MLASMVSPIWIIISVWTDNCPDCTLAANTSWSIVFQTMSSLLGETNSIMVIIIGVIFAEIQPKFIPPYCNLFTILTTCTQDKHGWREVQFPREGQDVSPCLDSSWGKLSSSSSSTPPSPSSTSSSHHLLRRCQKARRTSMCGPRICGAMLFFFGSSPQGKNLILILKYCFLWLKMTIWMQKAKEKRQLGREVINFGPQTIGQTLASSTRSCFPNTIYSLITFSSLFFIFRAYFCWQSYFSFAWIYFFREEPFGDLSPMEAGMKVGLPLTMNNP